MADASTDQTGGSSGAGKPAPAKPKGAVSRDYDVVRVTRRADGSEQLDVIKRGVPATRPEAACDAALADLPAEQRVGNIAAWVSSGYHEFDYGGEMKWVPSRKPVER